MSNKDVAVTKQEASFIMRQIPISRYRTVLDLCCGVGRHTDLLTQNGYHVIGVDRDKDALEHAKKATSGDAEYIQHDMRSISTLQYQFDAVISMWHSFGYFEEYENNNVIKQISEVLRTQGRFIIDIYNKSFMEAHLGERQITKGEMTITEQVSHKANRFHVTLAYGSELGVIDEFEWQLYTQDEIIQVCQEYNMKCITACANFDENQPISKSIPRMQLVFEKDAS